MDDDQLEYLNELDREEDAPSFIDRGLVQTQTIDLKDMMAELDSQVEGTQEVSVERTAFGKLMEALPIPAFWVDRSRYITFTNQACEKISPDYKRIEGQYLTSLFADPFAANEVQSLVEKVFAARQTQILEAVIRIGERQIWGRAHLRSVRWGDDPSLLVLVEDLTLEKKQIGLQKRLGRQLKRLVEERTAELAQTNEKLQAEVAERKNAEEELRQHRQHLEELVVERTAELNESVKRLKQEIKDRKKAESSVRSTEQRFNMAFRAYPGEVSIQALVNGRYLEVNDSFCRASGYERDEIIGRTDEELRYWARPAHREQLLNNLLEHGPVSDFEAVFRSKDGTMRVGSVSAAIIELDGDPHLLCVTTDITERKRAEREHRRLTTAVEHVAETILITDSRGAIKYANPAFEAAGGYAKEEIIGKNVGFIRSPNNDKAVLAEANLRLKEGKPWKGRLINKRKDETLYEVETTISPVTGQSGMTTNFVVVERVLSREDEPSPARSAAAGPTATAFPRLAANLATDVNNTMAAMLGYAYLMKRRLDTDSLEADYLLEILRAGNWMTELMDECLILAGKKALHRRPIELKSLVEQALVQVRSKLPSELELRAELGLDALPVLGDPSSLRRVVEELCAVAGRMEGSSLGVLTVDLTVEELTAESNPRRTLGLSPGRYAHLTVGGPSTSFSPGVLERAFEPYFTSRGLSAGRGLGLATVRAIASAHGGATTATLESGNMVAFHVYLPHSREIEEFASQVEPYPEETSEEILVVQGDDRAAGLYADVLRTLGFRASVAADLDEARRLAAARSVPFDLLIVGATDASLQGVKSLGPIRSEFPGIPSIVCADPGSFTREEALQTGFTDLLLRPVTPDLLGKTVCRILGAGD